MNAKTQPIHAAEWNQKQAAKSQDQAKIERLTVALRQECERTESIPRRRLLELIDMYG